MFTFFHKPILTTVTILFALHCDVLLAEDRRPNILFIMSDDHAVRAVSAYGSTLVATPNIDRIAANGVRFDRAYVGNAICGPSRATALTGLHSHGNDFYSNEWSGEFNGQQQTFPGLLQAAGYQTAVVGKWHLYSDPVGFDHWEVLTNAMEHGTYYNPSFRSPAGVEETTGYVADLITDKAIAWLKTVKENDRPFMLMYHHKTPHRDWMPGPQELENWDENERVEEPPSLLRDLGSLTQGRRQARMTISEYMTDQDVKLSKGKYLNPQQTKLWEAAFAPGNSEFRAAELSADDVIRWKYQRYVKTYRASVEGMDRQIGHMLDYLEANGLMENTLIVYTSDQGFFLGENGWFDKRWMDEVSSRVPLVMQWPGHIRAGTSTSGLVQNIDYAPTLLDAAGVKPEKPMHGVSLLPLIGSEPVEWKRDLYYQFYENPGFHGVARHYGVRTDRYKLVYYYRNDEWELFDLVEDPQDQVNLYGQSDYGDITRELKSRLNNLRRQYQLPDKDPSAPWYHGTAVRILEWWFR
ncbi:MAG: arylsulfatase A-like enzyme [Halieaceae bacterium]|jgi:arylsulfatase A-like enzyme